VKPDTPRYSVLCPKSNGTEILFGTYSTKVEAQAVRNRLIAVGGFARVVEGKADGTNKTARRARASR
jgi:hypothetical protein